MLMALQVPVYGRKEFKGLPEGYYNSVFYFLQLSFYGFDFGGIYPREIISLRYIGKFCLNSFEIHTDMPLFTGT